MEPIFTFDPDKKTEVEPSFVKEWDRLDFNLLELAEIFPSFIRYIYDWKFVVERNKIGSCYGYVTKDRGIDRYKVVAHPELFTFDDKKVKGFLVHEILHIYSKHFQRSEAHSKDVSIFIPKLGMCPSLWNIAQDLCINHTIENELKHKEIEMPAGICRFSDFPDDIRVNIEGFDSETVFDYLKELYEKNSERLKKIIESIAQKAFDDMVKNGNPFPQQGQPADGGSGSGGGFPVKINIGFDGHQDFSGIDAAGDPSLSGNADRPKISGGRGTKSADKFEAVIQDMVVKSNNNIKLEKILQAIRATITSNSSSVVAGIERSYRFYNRRYGSLNQVASRPIIMKGERPIKYQKELYIAIDTSYSVSDNDIEMAVQIVNRFLKDFHFKLTLIQADDHIQKVERVSQPMKNFQVVGRGGTDYQVVFDYIDKDISSKGINKKNTILVFIGDGGTVNMDKMDAHDVSTVWLLTECHAFGFEEAVQFGKKILIPELTNNRGI